MLRYRVNRYFVPGMLSGHIVTADDVVAALLTAGNLELAPEPAPQPAAAEASADVAAPVEVADEAQPAEAAAEVATESDA